jgi:hypothetical protein
VLWELKLNWENTTTYTTPSTTGKVLTRVELVGFGHDDPEHVVVCAESRRTTVGRSEMVEAGSRGGISSGTALSAR